MTVPARPHVLLIDADEDTYVLVDHLLREQSEPWDVVWASTFEAGRESWLAGGETAVLLAARIGERGGLDLFAEIPPARRLSPVILLTRPADGDPDAGPAHAGIADQLETALLTGPNLQRSLRYALDRQASAGARDHASALQIARYRVTGLLARPTSLSEVASELLEAIRSGIGWDLAMLWLPDERDERLHLAADARGPDGPGESLVEAARAMRFARGQSLSGMVWAGGEPIWIDDLDTARAAGRLGPPRDDGFRTALAFPLRYGTAISGVLSLFSSKRQAADSILLAALADIGEQIGQFQERKHVEAERDRLVLAMEQTADAVLMMDTDGRITYANTAAERASGRTRMELIGVRAVSLTRAAGWRDVRPVLIALREGRPWTGATQIERPNGTRITVELTISPFTGRSGATIGTVGVARDVTRERATEERLVQSQRLAGLGQLAGGIAHDFNNLLTAILGYAELASNDAAPNDPIVHDLSQIRDAAKRGASLVAQILAFARMQRLTPVVADCNAIIEGLLPMLSRVIGEHIDVQALLDPALGHVEVDPTQLEQVIVNLAVNARDAMPHGGVLRIETANVDITDADIGAMAGMATGRYVRISMADSGVGMDADTAGRAFDPFFTTKGPGRGTGLGLATVYGIVAQSHGHIWLYSEPGHGTTFRLVLPRVDAPVVVTLPSRDSSHLDGTETVLLVEDEPGVRELTRRVLERHGYDVLPASRGDEALTILAERDGHVDLLLTDLVMPGMNGSDLADRAAREHALTRVVFMSGYSEDVVTNPSSRGRHMAKPFSPTQLLTNVRAELDREPKAP